MLIHNGPNPTKAQLVEELSTELEYFAGGSHAAFLGECSEIAFFLSDINHVSAGLKALEQTLEVKVGQHLDKVLAHYRKKSAGQSSTLDELRHLLSQEMTGMEIRWGFSGFEAKGYKHGEKVQTYTRFVDPKAFLRQVELGRHWKDPTVPGMHGEYAHRLQWYLAGTQLGDVIKRPLVDVFRETAGVSRKGDFTYGLWYALFDRDNGIDKEAPFKVATGGIVDSRSPESLTRYIIDDATADKCPILHWFVRSRLKKRDGAQLNNYGNMKVYVQKKLAKHGLNINPDEILGRPSARGGQRGGTGILVSGNEIKHH
jgi:hypothetical protein